MPTVAELAGFEIPRSASYIRAHRSRRRQRHRRQVFARDGNACTYCGALATTVDHVIPLSKGGEDTVENQVPACWPCNQALDRLGL